MLDEQDPEARPRERDEEVTEVRRLAFVEPRRRLVEQQDAWPCGEGPSELDESRLSGRERPDRELGDVAQVETLEDQVDLLVRGRVGAASDERRSDSTSTRPDPTDLEPDADVVAHGQRGEDLETLEGASDAGTGTTMGAHP